jgi:AraC-like DNA-binding protein
MARRLRSARVRNVPIDMAMRYVEYAPDPRLAGFVRCYWIFEAHRERADGGTANDETVVPDGHPELIFHFGAPFAEVLDPLHDDGLRVQPAALFAGQLTRPLRLRPSGPPGTLGVRFHPWGARWLSRMPMAETTDRWLALDATEYGWLAGVDDAVRDARDDRARVAAIEARLLARLAAVPAAVDRQVLALARDWRAAGSRVRHSVGSRQLERRFNDAIGVPPKVFHSIARFRALFDALSASPRPAWLDAAIASGYFDQSHMIRDFRRFAGAPPTAFIRSLGGLSAALLDL